MTDLRPRFYAIVAATLFVSACASSGGPDGAAPAPAGEGTASPATEPAPAPAVFQPGAPGQATRRVSADAFADASEAVTHTEADVRFMQMMIPHHAQALEMTALVREHATTDAVRQMALRMEISQRDEIALMENWLRDRGETAHMHGGMALMPGMLTPEQMEELRTARGVEFDRLFLTFMIQHHQGAVDMVAELFATPGAGQESSVFHFADDVDSDQTMEIERMRRVLAGLRVDNPTPR